jgi:LysR family transcriptional regulator, transcriptional activator for dmlA
LCALYSVSSRLTPKVKVFLDFIDTHLGTDRDPRLHGAKAKECFTNVGVPVGPGSFEK